MHFINELHMKPEFNSKRLFGITRSKGKMYELEVPENLHISIPSNSNPEQLLILTIGILGDAVAHICNHENDKLPEEELKNLLFSASFFDAFVESKLNSNINFEMMLIASATYYLAGRPGSSLVIAKKLFDDSNNDTDEKTSLQQFLQWLLYPNWMKYPKYNDSYYSNYINRISKLLAFHFFDGSNLFELKEELNSFRNEIYKNGSAIELLYSEIIIAIALLRLKFSAWNTLPQYSGIEVEQWRAE